MARFGISDWFSGTKQADGGFAMAMEPATLGAQTSANSQSIVPASDALFKVAGSFIYASASLVPTSASYTAGNTLGAATALVFTYADGTAVPATAGIRILSASLKIDQTAMISGEGAYTAQIYGVTPPSAFANNTAWTLTTADLAAYQDSISLGTPVDLGTACFVKSSGIDKQFELTAGGVFMYLTTGATFTAVAGVNRQVRFQGIVL